MTWSIEAQALFENAMKTAESGLRAVLLEKAVRLDPDYFEAHVELGRAYVKLGKLKLAERSYITALAISDDGFAHLLLGNVYYATGDLDAAVREFRRGGELEPVDSLVAYCLGDVAWKSGDLEQAEAHYRESVRLCPDNANARRRLGVFLIETDRAEHGAVELRRAYALEPLDHRVIRDCERYSVLVEAPWPGRPN